MHLLVQFALAGYVLLRLRQRLMGLVALAGVALAVLAGTAIYEDFWSYSRVLVWLPLGLALAGLHARRGWILFALTPAAIWTVAVSRVV